MKGGGTFWGVMWRSTTQSAFFVHKHVCTHTRCSRCPQMCAGHYGMLPEGRSVPSEAPVQCNVPSAGLTREQRQPGAELGHVVPASATSGVGFQEWLRLPGEAEGGRILATPAINLSPGLAFHSRPLWRQSFCKGVQVFRQAAGDSVRLGLWRLAGWGMRGSCPSKPTSNARMEKRKEGLVRRGKWSYRE